MAGVSAAQGCKAQTYIPYTSVGEQPTKVLHTEQPECSQSLVQWSLQEAPGVAAGVACTDILHLQKHL